MNQSLIEFIPIDALNPHPHNSRIHSPDQVAQIAASIDRFGFRGCILIDEDNIILAGHGRTMAMRHLGRDTIPCQRVTGLTDAEKRAYVIADNQTAENSEWDLEIRASELQHLAAAGIDMADFGIPAAALQSLTEQPAETVADLRALEAKTDTASPASVETFESEMARTDTAGLLPIVPLYAEHHEAFIILCDNAIDEAWLRNKLGLDLPMQSYKDVKSQRANVITVQQYRERITGNQSA